MSSAREQAKDAANGFTYTADCANAASDVWEPKMMEAIALLEKYERAMWLQTHDTFGYYKDSYELWSLKEFVNG